MALRFFSVEQRPDLAERYGAEAEAIWPPGMRWIDHDPACEEYWPRLEVAFPAFQFVGYDEAAGQFLAVGNTVPVAWSGIDAELPDGVPDALRRAFAGGGACATPTALCALLAGIQPSARSHGVSSQVLLHMRALAGQHALEWLIAPVRPTLKARYPLTAMERYATWRRADGQLLDPWLRTHERLGARMAGLAPRGNVFRGTVAQWEEWTGLALPESGRYVVPDALEPLQIDRERDEGVLIEPNVWMVHPVA